MTVAFCCKNCGATCIVATPGVVEFPSNATPELGVFAPDLPEKASEVTMNTRLYNYRPKIGIIKENFKKAAK